MYTLNKQDILSILKYVFAFVKWIVISAIVGAVGGFVGVAFHVSVEKVTELRLEHSWLVFLLPVGGLVIAGLYKLCKLEHAGTNNVIDSVRTDKKVPFLLPPLIFVATVITHLFGGSAGREGAALQLGGGIGTDVGKLFRLDEKDMHLATLCGMSAVFAALFGTPLTAALFALEVISVGIVYYSGIIPCLVSSLIAYLISLMFKVEPVRFTLANAPEYNVPDFFRVAGLAVGGALMSILFCVAMHYTERFGRRFLKNSFLRVVAGGALIIILTMIFGRDYNGAGMNIIQNAVEHGNAVWYACILKIIFTAITIASGYKGGEIVPTLFIGSTFGCVFGALLGLDPGFGAAIGMVAMFCGVVNCPIASIFLSVEIFGAGSLLYFAVACGVGYMLSGYFGVYSSQKIMYSKTRAEYINKNTR